MSIRDYGWWVIAQGMVSLGWLIVEVAMLRLIVWPHYLYGAVAIVLATSGIVIVRTSLRKGAASKKQEKNQQRLNKGAQKLLKDFPPEHGR